VGNIDGSAKMSEHGYDGLDGCFWNEFADGGYHACYSVSNNLQ
jgi:hypothetical protein